MLHNLAFYNVPSASLLYSSAYFDKITFHDVAELRCPHANMWIWCQTEFSIKVEWEGSFDWVNNKQNVSIFLNIQLHI